MRCHICLLSIQERAGVALSSAVDNDEINWSTESQSSRYIGSASTVLVRHCPRLFYSCIYNVVSNYLSQSGLCVCK